MLSFTNLKTLFTDLSLNTTTSNNSRGGNLMNIEHRYLLQKYFSNEGNFSVQTIGQTELTLASNVPINSTSLTLAAAWQYPTNQALLTFSDGQSVLANFTNGSTSVNWIPATTGLMYLLSGTLVAGATSAMLASAWAGASGSYLTSFSDGSTKTVTYTKGSTSISWTGGLAGAQSNQIFTSTILSGDTANIGGVQFYPFPPNYSKLKDITITVGQLRWTLTEVRTRTEWDNLNVFPYYASIPSKYFIYPGGDKGGYIGIWPIPSTTGNVINYNYKFRVPDLSIEDYTTGTVSLTNGSTAVTGSSTSWTVTANSQLESRWIQIPQPSGDNLWYQVATVNNGTSLTLYQPYQGVNVSGASYTLGQMPLIAEDFQDMLLWKALQYYYTSIKDDPKKAQEYKDIYERKIPLLEEYSGTTTLNVNLSRKGRMKNPNSFVQTVGNNP